MSSKFIPGIASQSLGCPRYHNIKEKLQATARSGMRAVEIFFEDIERYATSENLDIPTLPSSTFDFEHYSHEQQLQLACAQRIRQWCLEAYPGAPKLEVICLQPFMHFEGLLDPKERKQRLEKLHFWIEIAKCLGTDLIQIPSNFLSMSECTGDRARLVEDLRTAADIGAAQTPTMRFAYEALCWGTHIDTWDAAWSIVEEVDRFNFGTCLDTFNMAGRVFADPERADGKNVNAYTDISQSIQKLRDTFDDPAKLRKIFYVELCDGERLDSPISPDHEWYNEEQPSRMTWSRNARLYPFETDAAEAAAQGRNPGYLPVIEIFRALLDVGYEGYLSFEVFNRSLNQPDKAVVAQHAARVEESWKRCVEFIEQYFADKALSEDVVDKEETLSFDESTNESSRFQELGVTGNAGTDLVGISSRL